MKLCHSVQIRTCPVKLLLRNLETVENAFHVAERFPSARNTRCQVMTGHITSDRYRCN
jgi:hypothetical protein